MWLSLSTWAHRTKEIRHTIPSLPSRILISSSLLSLFHTKESLPIHLFHVVCQISLEYKLKGISNFLVRTQYWSSHRAGTSTYQLNNFLSVWPSLCWKKNNLIYHHSSYWLLSQTTVAWYDHSLECFHLKLWWTCPKLSTICFEFPGSVKIHINTTQKIWKHSQISELNIIS